MKLPLLFLFSLSIFTISAQNPSFWSDAYGPSFRHLKAVEILDNDRFIGIGGNETNDAISTIIYSDNLGTNWQFAMDNINAILQDVDFTSLTTGYTVGWSGNIWKTNDTGDNWSQITVPGNAGNRNYNGCYFMDDNTGVVVGGNESMDSIQTIVRTSDGGNNWSVISDNLGSWLRAVHFYDANTGLAVGDRGTILKTVDGGLNWTDISANSGVLSRQLNDVFMIDENTAIAVGGWPDNDSIQTIIRTTDGGANWGVVNDNLGSMLNGVFFKNSMEGYTVGDDGTVLTTNDQGISWQILTIPNNDIIGLQDVFVKNESIGLFGGDNGKLLWYVDTTPTDAIGNLVSPIVVYNSNTVYIEGTIDDLGISTSITFEYGTTMSFGTDVLMTPEESDLSGIQNVELTLSGLTPDLLYFGRMKLVNQFGTSYSDAISFYTGIDQVVNYNFEEWNEFTYDILNDWSINGNLNKVASYNSTNAVELTTVNNEPGAILYGAPGQNELSGGIPFTERPDTLSAWIKYDISVGDTALILLQLKDNGTIIADSMYAITGNSGGVFLEMKYKINYTSSNFPDSLIIAFVNTNVFSGTSDPNSMITIDDVTFIGTTTILANYDMEGWSVATRHKAVSWISRDDERAVSPYMVNRTSNAYSGDYAVLLSNLFTGENDEFAMIKTGDSLQDNYPSFPVDYNHNDLYGFVKFEQDNGDSLQFLVDMYENGVQIGNGIMEIDSSITEYTLINVPLNYWGAGTADSCSIQIRIHNDNNLPGVSFAHIDNLSFDSYLSEFLSANDPIEKSQLSLSLFPNPSDGPFTIQFSEAIIELLVIQIFDINGKLVQRSNENIYGNTLSLDLSHLSPDFYFVVIQVENNIYTLKTLIK